MNKVFAFYLSLALSIMLMLYGESGWRGAGLVLFALLMLGTIAKMLNTKVPGRPNDPEKK